jgi:diguanylate cyclase (GGDEF)-like protein
MKTILIIDDEETLRTALCHLIAHLKYQTISASNGTEGIRLARETKPDLILCDVNMPGMSGHDVLNKIRTDPSTSFIPFIFLTGQGEREDLRKGMNSGADDYLTKPVSLSELESAISVRLHRRQEITHQYVNELHRVEEKLQHLSYFDPKTELPNHLSLAEEFQRVIVAGATEIKVLSITIDQFKRFTGTFGAEQRDLFVNMLAKRLRQCAAQNRFLGKVAENEFACVIASNQQAVRFYADEILQCVEKPFAVESCEYRFTASIGIASYPEDGEHFEDLLGKAVSTSIRATEQGGNDVLFFSALDCIKTHADLLLESELRKAIEQQSLELYFQPQIDTKNGDTVGCEALLRWNHPTQGMISPSRIINIAEGSGLIVPLGEWVLRKACLVLRTLNENRRTHLRMSINLSPYQFRRPDFVERLVHIVRESGADPGDIDLEVTESVLIEDPEAAYKKLHELRSLEFHISLDDFGTGYSSFTYLKSLPLDSLKIDRAFIRNIQEDATNRAIVLAILQMAKSLNLKVVAEGVETSLEFAFLYSAGCDEVQGYFFSPAVPLLRFKELIRPIHSRSSQMEASSA